MNDFCHSVVPGFDFPGQIPTKEIIISESLTLLPVELIGLITSYHQKIRPLRNILPTFQMMTPFGWGYERVSLTISEIFNPLISINAEIEYIPNNMDWHYPIGYMEYED